MDYCAKILKIFNCCEQRSTHIHGVSVGTLILSDAPSESLQDEELMPADSISIESSSIVTTNKINEVPNPPTINFYTHSSTPDMTNPEQIWDTLDSNDFAAIQEMINSQEIALLEDCDGFTLLHRSVISGNTQITEALIGLMDVNKKDIVGRTALHYAYMRNSQQIIINLLENGADQSISDKFGRLARDYSNTRVDIKEIISSINNFHHASESAEVSNNKKYKSSGKLAKTNDNSIEKTHISGNLKHRKLTGPLEDSIALRMIDEFTAIKVLDASIIGVVYLIKHITTGFEYAMKVIDKEKVVSDREISMVETERKVLSEFNHPFIVKLEYAMQTSKKLIMVMEYCTRGSLAKVLALGQPLEKDRIRRYASEIILALEYIHAKGYTYRSLVPKNVLINESGHAVLNEFQLSKFGIAVESTNDPIEYLQAVAPEVTKGVPYSGEVDWYMLGRLLYQMSTGSHYSIPPKLIPSKSLSNLIESLLEPTPWKRLGFFSGASALKSHKFFKSLSWSTAFSTPPNTLPPRLDTQPQLVPLDLSKTNTRDPRFPNWSFISNSNL